MEFNTLTLQYPCLCLCIKRDDMFNLSICLDISEKIDYHTFKVLILLGVPHCAIWHWCLKWNKKHNISQQYTLYEDQRCKMTGHLWLAFYPLHVHVSSHLQRKFDGVVCWRYSVLVKHFIALGYFHRSPHVLSQKIPDFDSACMLHFDVKDSYTSNPDFRFNKAICRKQRLWWIKSTHMCLIWHITHAEEKLTPGRWEIWDIHPKLKTREISFVHNIRFIYAIVWICYIGHGSTTTVPCVKFRNDWMTEIKVMDKRDLC